MDAAIWDHWGKKRVIVDGLLIGDKTGSTKRKYKGMEKNRNSKASLNLNHIKTFKIFKIILTFRRIIKSPNFVMPCSAHIYNSVCQKIAAS